LKTSILDGKGMEMPPQIEEVSEEQVGALVAYVRAFARTREKPGDKEKGGLRWPASINATADSSRK
jgi:hypothetical protein